MINKDYVNSILEYKDGDLYWKVAKGNVSKGTKAGRNRLGYFDTCIDKKRYQNHRLIWLLHYGYYPVEIDHIDGNPSNNRIENLREATRKENCRNRKVSVLNTSGCKNVCWHKKTKKWMVAVNKIYIGLFESLELAELVAIEARNKYHGKFANHANQS